MSTLQELVLGILEKKCYEVYNLTTSYTAINDLMCEAVFDGLYCWPYTKAGVLAVQPCSNNVVKSTILVS